MDVQFKLNGVSLDHSEAEMLLATQKSKFDNGCLELDIGKYFKVDKINAKTLFALSIEKQRPELAALAAKIAINKPGNKSKTRKRTRGVKRINDVEAKTTDIDECLDYLLTQRKLGCIGAAMVLETANEQSPITLKDIAVLQVNKCWDKGMNERSAIFRGFFDNGEAFEPYVTKAEKGLVTFHSSPLYNALRDGLKYLINHGLAEAKAETSWGSDTKQLEGSAAELRRVVYEVNLTKKGEELVNRWNDISLFIYSYWESRLK